MMEGFFVEPLGCYLMVERSKDKVVRIYFSTDQPAGPSELARDIASYLRGRAPCPETELDLSGLTNFQKRIFSVVREIPRGQTRTYGEVAASAGRPKAARAVGRAMASNPFVILVPCHRVVAKRGLGGFSGGLDLKEKLLALEKSKS
jgi:methylated-DNA-[protein]-cysteine S-methyltransferase